MVYMCPMKQTVCVNIVDFKMCYFDYAHQNKKSTFQNSFSQKKKKQKKEDSLVLFFIKPNVEWQNFPKLFRSFFGLLLSVTDADHTHCRRQIPGFQH